MSLTLGLCWRLAGSSGVTRKVSCGDVAFVPVREGRPGPTEASA